MTMKITLTIEQKRELKPENGGSQSRLSATQTMELIEHLTEKTYFHTRQIVIHVEAAVFLMDAVHPTQSKN